MISNKNGSHIQFIYANHRTAALHAATGQASSHNPATNERKQHDYNNDPIRRGAVSVSFIPSPFIRGNISALICTLKTFTFLYVSVHS